MIWMVPRPARSLCSRVQGNKNGDVSSKNQKYRKHDVPPLVITRGVLVGVLLNELLGGRRVRNRGICSDRTRHLADASGIPALPLPRRRWSGQAQPVRGGECLTGIAALTLNDVAHVSVVAVGPPSLLFPQVVFPLLCSRTTCRRRTHASGVVFWLFVICDNYSSSSSPTGTNFIDTSACLHV